MSPLAVSNWELLIILSFSLLLAGIYGYATFRLDRYVRRKGYQSPFRAMGMICGYLAALSLGGYFASLAPDLCWQCTPADNPERFRPEFIWSQGGQFAEYFFAGCTPPIILLAGIAWLIPRRSRQFGTRRVRMPWQAIANLWLALIPISLLAEWHWRLGFTVAYRTSILLSAAYAGCSYLAKRMHNKGLAVAMLDDPRAPVFYLREFEKEDEVFASLSYNDCLKFEVPMLNIGAFRHPATLEQYLQLEIKRNVGPFIALGDPYDYIPPAGAEREYFHDDNWKEAFRKLAHESRFIIMRPGHSDNLKFELMMIREFGLLAKLFVVTKPARKRQLLPKEWSPQAEQRGWEQFVSDLKAAGLGGVEYPGRGAVVGFHSDGTALIVNVNALTPTDYVNAIQRRCEEIDQLKAKSAEV